MFNTKMINSIKYAIEKHISSIETKKGYNGAPILRIGSEYKDVLEDIKKWTTNLGYSSVIYSDKEGIYLGEENTYSIFIVFGEDTIDNEIYGLKS